MLRRNCPLAGPVPSIWQLWESKWRFRGTWADTKGHLGVQTLILSILGRYGDTILVTLRVPCDNTGVLVHVCSHDTFANILWCQNFKSVASASLWLESCCTHQLFTDVGFLFSLFNLVVLFGGFLHSFLIPMPWDREEFH